ncbi:MAG: hypothetical protein AB1405_02250 [Bdellovibrionota bacterium]
MGILKAKRGLGAAFLLSAVFLLKVPSTQAQGAFAPPRAPEGMGVAVARFSATGEAEKKLAEGLSGVFGSEFSAGPCLRVVSDQAIEDLARRLGLEQQLGASAGQVDLARLAKAHFLVRGELSRVSKRYLLNISVIDLATGSTAHAERVWASEASLARRTGEAARRFSSRVTCTGLAAAGPAGVSGRKVLVHGFVGSSGLADVLPAAMETAAAELRAWTPATIASRAEVEVPGNPESWRGCNASRCLDEIAGTLGAQEIVQVRLVEGAEQVLVIAERRAAGKSDPLERAQSAWKGARGDLPALAALLSLSLYTDVAQLPDGEAQVFCTIPARALLSGEDVGVADTKGLSIPAAPGEYLLELLPDGALPVSRPIVILPGKTSTASESPAALLAEGPPFYKTWWFWTVAGAAAVGLGVGIPVAMSGDSAPAGQPVTIIGPAP